MLVYDCKNIPTAAAEVPGGPLQPLDRRTFTRSILLWMTAVALPVRPALFATDLDVARHVVRKGETLWHIAARHGTTVASLKRWNGLKSDRIRPGQRLRVRASREYVNPEAIFIRGLDTDRWKHLIVHHSATATGNAAKFDAYHRRERHMENGLAYHFLIGNGTDSGDGLIEIGPRWTKQLHGGHVASLAYNKNSIGVCLVGNFEKTRPTPRQLAALIELLGHLKDELLDGKPRLFLHREVKGEHTLCPGRNFPAKRIHQRFD